MNVIIHRLESGERRLRARDYIQRGPERSKAAVKDARG